MTDAPGSPAFDRAYEATKPIEMFPGVIRRTLVSGERLTLVEIHIEADHEVPQHTHPHEQAGQVVSGRVLFRFGDGDTARETELGAGASYMIPGGEPHYVRAIEAATLIDVFSPVREEYAND
jgi:quercetin dioxygenase-like cupin family protein